MKGAETVGGIYCNPGDEDLATTRRRKGGEKNKGPSGETTARRRTLRES